MHQDQNKNKLLLTTLFPLRSVLLKKGGTEEKHEREREKREDKTGNIVIEFEYCLKCFVLSTYIVIY